MEDPMDLLADPDLRATLLFARARQEPVTSDEVAAAMSVHRSVARFRLERLAAAGLLEPATASRVGGRGAGRPAKTYAVAPETEQVEFPPRRYDELLGLLIAALPARGRPRVLEAVGVEFGRQLARAGGLRRAAQTRAALDRVCRALGKLGFQVSVASLDANQAVLETPTCPLRPLVLVDGEARALDQGMWRGLVGEALAEGDVAEVRCHTHDCMDPTARCRVVVELR